MDAWQMGYEWAQANFYIDHRGRKNVNGGRLGAWLASIGRAGNEAAEGVRYFLSQK